VPLNDAIARMRGKPGTPVALTIKRGVDEEITLTVTRDTIRRQALRASMEGDVLVLRLGSFSGAVASALQKAIQEATASATPRGVILDLRGNPGGLLREAVLTADTFLRGGEIVSLRGRTGGPQRSWQADATELLPDVPLVVLVDRRSASASELVAAALQENGRATVIGQRSFGKGTVQSTYPLGGELKSALKLTTSIYHGPSGRTVQKNGVTPDIELLTAAPARGDASRMEAMDFIAPTATQVEQSRCAALHPAPDATISCAIAFLQAGDRSLFLAKVGVPGR
jgi:carboxyl-terminal processing protease